MTDQINDITEAQTAKDNIPTMSNTMDNIHGTTEDISNKASGYKVYPTLSTASQSLLSSPQHKLTTSTNHQATISTPNTSESAKQNAKEQLEKLGGEDAFMKNNNKGE